MRALVLNDTLQLETEHSNPDIVVGEALIRVHQAGICATDLELVKGYMGFQGTLGHEFVGVIEQAAGQPQLIGRRVAGEINAACRSCETCRAGRLTHCPHRTVLGIDHRNGAFADYLCLPYENVHILPKSITDDQAVFVEPLAAACEILQQVVIKPTDRIVVLGDGKLGLLCAQVLQLTGCQLEVLGHHAEKLNILAKRGIRIATSLEHITPGADIIIEATGTPHGLTTAAQLVRPRGTIVLKSTYHGDVTVNMTSLVINEVTLIGSRCGPFEPAIRLLEQQLVDVTPLIHAHYPIDDALTALDSAGTKGTLKVMLTMT
ncbi:MAG: alcohol dehydrogenase catalytic domain-containing protein [Nitrospirales bacterium]|nr:alcohol dehydrogenase catalytic domain-containing protein [Nitrospirales bacterium]